LNDTPQKVRKILHTATKSRWQTTVGGILPGIVWGLVVLALTLAVLVLGAIVLPSRAGGLPIHRTQIASQV
jgi:hypothetical protein